MAHGSVGIARLGTLHAERCGRVAGGTLWGMHRCPQPRIRVCCTAGRVSTILTRRRGDPVRHALLATFLNP